MIPALLIVAQLAAQSGSKEVRVPVQDDILSQTMSPQSPYFYRPMMERYMAGDTTLTLDHYYYLYYGAPYEPGFDARRELPGEAEIAMIFARHGETLRGEPTREEAQAIIDAARRNMTVDPFSPSNINLMTFAYQVLGDTLAARASADRFEKIISTITSSGSGRNERSPWHILRYSHADDIIETRGLTVTNRQVRARDVEYIQVERNPEGVRGYFFNFGRVYGRGSQ
jgi:hypothetical protein